MKTKRSGKFGPVEGWSKEVTCGKQDKLDENGCGAVFEVVLEDLVWAYWHGTHFRHHYPAIRCPECGKLNQARDVSDALLAKLAEIKPKADAEFDGFSDAI